ncbi:enoyl-CoA hydratase/isomerase family protein [Xanthobacter autotrophicus]|uniref:enoyl-CoA hydratase/isomerase family protein n=1 Tax=Xanthobacter TaxID=279 RepID=UPI0024AAFC77|nr:enoyl-CoA hydratase/isomerase family protein [Xanthobacter autotrophicus]MDI4663576.1 enoyl-CoA hydratase/isomerase family protein [Xanthobacter autotrophicus]
MTSLAPRGGDDRLTLAFDGAVATVTLCRPPVNAIDDAMLDALLAAIARVEANGQVSLLRFRSRGKLFCAGADLEMVAARVARDTGAEEMVSSVRRFHEVFDRLAALPAVTLAEIEGHALGGGLELALACDLRIAAWEAKLGLPEAKVGLLPGAGGTQRLTRLCGPGVAARIILSGDVIDGREAERLGLVQWAVPAAEFAEKANEVAVRIAALSPEALREAKRCIGIAAAIAADGAQAEIGGIGALMREPGTRRRVTAFLAR